MWCNAWSFKIIEATLNPKNCRKTSLILKNSKVYQKIPKVRWKDMKCMRKREKSTYQMKKNDLETKDWVRKKIWMLERCLGRWRSWKDWEKWIWNREVRIYRKFINLDRSRAIEELSRIKWEAFSTMKLDGSR